jgi:predicted nucleic acid-binding protein
VSRKVYVFDTGALIGLERRDIRITKVFRFAIERKDPIVVPMPVIGEWWRGRTDWREKLLQALLIEPLRLTTIKAAGETLAAVKPRRGRADVSLVDAIVMATAAELGGIVYTSDFEDLEHLTSHFPGVKVLRTDDATIPSKPRPQRR